MKKIILNYIKTDLLKGQDSDDITAKEDLLGSGLIDSLGMIKLIGFIERQFEIKVLPQDMTIDNFMTVELMENYINQRTTK